MYIFLIDSSSFGSHRARSALVYPLFDLPQSGIEAYGCGIDGRNLHSIVFARIVRSRNLHRCAESVVCRTEIYHRRGAESYVINICPSVVYAPDHCIVHLVRGQAAVSSQQHLVSLEKFRDEISHLVGNLRVPIDVPDAPYVVCVKCSHINIY